MPRPLDLAGQRFGRLVAVQPACQPVAGHRAWRCVCDCGNEHTATANNLRRGLISSCGCFRREFTIATRTTHGMSRSRTYRSWQSMLARCYRPTASGYAEYGGRGITVCDRWRESFENFLADMGERPAGTSLDRWPDGRGNYESANCRWATAREQRMNQLRGTITLEQAAEVRRLHAEEGLGNARIAKRLGISIGAASGVLYLGNLRQDAAETEGVRST